MQHWLEVVRDWIGHTRLAQWIDASFDGHGVFVLFISVASLALIAVLAASLAGGVPPRPKASTRGTTAIVETLATWAARPGNRTGWMLAADLAAAAGVSGVHDPQFEADVQALYDAGTIQLTTAGPSASQHFAEAMLVPPAAPPAPPAPSAIGVSN